MEKKTDLDKTKLLIDLNSPISKRLPSTPLIPIPSSKNEISVSPTNNNPFDVVARQTFSPRANDPFESVFKNAFYGVKDGETNSFDFDESKGSVNSEDNELKDKSDEENVLLGKNEQHYKPSENQKIGVGNKCKDKKYEVNQKTILNVKSKYITDNVDHNIVVNVRSNKHENSFNLSPITKCPFKVVSKNTKLPCKNTISDSVENTQDPIQTHYSEKSPKLQSASQSLPLSEGDSHREYGDFSTDESLKAIIAKRVNKCIQKVLNNSLKPKFSKLNGNLKPISDNTSAKQTCNRRSLSFISLSTTYTKCDRLNKSCTDSCDMDEVFNLENPELLTPDSSVGSCDVKPSSPLLGEVSRTEEMKEEVFKEANKLARTFSKIAESFCKNTDSDNEEDLLSCKPRWSYADSSEDEEEKLRNDPALNIRVSQTNSMIQGQTDSKTESPALKAFKTRNRRSLDLNGANSAEKETRMKRSNSVGDRPVTKNVPVIPSIVSSVPVVIVNPEENPIKLKKQIAKNSKRGPMRAVIPVQSMTKETLPFKGKFTKEEVSPVRKQCSVQLMETPHKDNSQLGMQPVASSTPNKSITGMSQLLAPAIEVPSNKRRSLGSTLESRKSRTPLADEGSRKRSNSASSNIPGPMVSVKPFKGLSLTPKSTSCLPRSSTSSQVSVHHDNKTDKKSKPAPKSSSNLKAVNEVKSKTARPGRIKAAVNTISNLVAGKGKKVAARDKENRFPV